MAHRDKRGAYGQAKARLAEYVALARQGRNIPVSTLQFLGQRLVDAHIDAFYPHSVGDPAEDIAAAADVKSVWADFEASPRSEE